MKKRKGIRNILMGRPNIKGPLEMKLLEKAGLITPKSIFKIRDGVVDWINWIHHPKNESSMSIHYVGIYQNTMRHTTQQ
jgi:hypothetical protein